MGKAIAEVLADKIYSSNEFGKVKENFTSIAKSLEQSEVKEWLVSTKETLMGDKDPKSKGAEENKLKAVLDRFDALLPKVTDTRAACDSLWKAYQYTDELTPHMSGWWRRECWPLETSTVTAPGRLKNSLRSKRKLLTNLTKRERCFKRTLQRVLS